MAKTKKRTARIGLVYDDRGHFMTSGEWMGSEELSDSVLIDLALKSWSREDMPHECIVEVELGPLNARVVKVTHRKGK